MKTVPSQCKFISLTSYFLALAAIHASAPVHLQASIRFLFALFKPRNRGCANNPAPLSFP